MAKVEAAAPAAKVALYEKVVSTLPGVARKGAMLPYTSLNGNMFSQMTKDGAMILRLPPDERDDFLRKYKTTLSVQYGVVQKEYVVVPDALLKRTAELRPYFAMSHAYVQSLRPKPTTKPAKSGGSKTAATKRSAKK
jgi:hypothetical protein